jgi:hypothetical protein
MREQNLCWLSKNNSVERDWKRRNPVIRSLHLRKLLAKGISPPRTYRLNAEEEGKTQGPLFTMTVSQCERIALGRSSRV